MSTMVLERPTVTAPPRIAKGVEYLDRNRPGWEHEIDTQLLDMHYDKYCVLGQLFGSHDAVVYVIFPDPSYTIDYGFHVGYDEIQGFEELTTMWRDYIEQRRAT